MKKFVIFALIAAMTAGVAFAQTADGISVNAWGRGVFAPLQAVGQPQLFGENVDKVLSGKKDAYWGVNDQGTDSTSDDTWELIPANPGTMVDGPGSRVYTGTGATWGGPNVRTGFNINGNAEFIGFQIQLNEGGVAAGDNVYIWAKPFSSDILKLSVGKFDDLTLQGKVNTDTGFENFVLGPMEGDAIFTRIRIAGNGSDYNLASHAPQGYMLSSEPMDGLFIALAVNGALDNWGNPGTLANDAFRFMQVGFGYKIPDIGHLRAQYIGGWMGYDSKAVKKDIEKGNYTIGPDGKPARIEVAFALDGAIEGLLVDLGLRFWMPQNDSETKKNTSNGIDINVGAKYNTGAFGVTAQFGFFGLGNYSRGEDDKSTGDFGSIDLAKEEFSPGFQINLIPTYDLDTVTIGASIGMAMLSGPGKDKDGKAPEADYKWSAVQFGFGGFVQKGLGSGSIKAGLAYKAAPSVTVGKSVSWGPGEAKSGACGSGVFTIPIILEYAFF